MSSAASTPHPLLGVGLILAAATTFATMDTTVRHLGAQLSVLLLLTARYLFQALVMAAWILASPRLSLRPAHPRFQAVRGALLLTVSIFSFYAVQFMPVAEFTAIHMLTPVLITLMAGWWLHEPVSAGRWALVLGAFAGTLIVIRPGSGLFGWAALLPLAGACCYAAFQVLTRRLAGHEHPLTTHFWTGAFGSAVMVPVLMLSPVDVAGTLAAATPTQWTLMLAIGALGTLGHLVLILAYGVAPATRLTPFMYAQIAAAALLGWWVLGDAPDGWSWFGMGVIAACGAAIAWLNARPAAAIQED